jgi:hypothetical protein
MEALLAATVPVWRLPRSSRGLKIALTLGIGFFLPLWAEAVRLGLTGAFFPARLFGLSAILPINPLSLPVVFGTGILAIGVSVIALTVIWRHGFVHLVAIVGPALIISYDGRSQRFRRLALAELSRIETENGLSGVSLIVYQTKNSAAKPKRHAVCTFGYADSDRLDAALIVLRGAVTAAKLVVNGGGV